ncbi:MAG TPA: hypothetical protein VJ499_10195 [Flavisolibacter sp.]|nr:hypothetical protein [Flavisolibacter sp.]
MKRIFLLLSCWMMIMLAFPSCTSMKRDCQGNKHVRLKNGIYL